MKLYGWQKVGSAEEYREMIRTEYYRLKQERDETGQGSNLEEVKLRLFLSLLDKPGVKSLSESEDPTGMGRYPSAA